MTPKHFSLWRSLTAGSCLLLGALAGHSRAGTGTLSNNLAAQAAYTETVQSQTWVGAPFRTGSTAVAVNGIDLPLNVPQAGAAVLVLDSGTSQPGNLVAALTPLQAPVISTFMDFTPGWGVTDNRAALGFTAQSEPMPERSSPAPMALGIGLCALALFSHRRLERARLLRRQWAVAGAIFLPLFSPFHSTAATPSAVQIVAPGPGESVRNGTVPAVVRVNPAIAGEPLEVWLNGKSVGTLFTRSGHCQQDGCPYSATLGTGNGLRAGKNLLLARLGAATAARGAWQTSFDWTGNGQLGDASVTLPPAVGFTTAGPGGGGKNGWVQLFFNQWGGTTVTYPTAKTTACTTTYQVLALNRQTLQPKTDAGYTDGYACFDTDQALTAALKTFTPGDLVIAGTSYTRNALPQLDTSPIGGVNYGAPNFPPNDFPRGYMVIGVGQARSGQAYENASTWESGDSPDNWARANGLLAVDGGSNYNFHPFDYVEFKVRPSRNPNFFGSITVGGATYTPPPVDYRGGGFWVLLLDRRNLFSQPGCAASPTDPNLYPNCGTYYQTDIPTVDDPDADKKAWATLATALKSAGKSQLIILVAMGHPSNTFEFPSADLADAINNLGGPGYALGRLDSTTYPQEAAGPAFTLISSNDEGFSQTLTGSAVVSTTVGEGVSGGNNGETGYVKGVLSRDHNGLFRPLAASQESSSTIDSSSAADFSPYPVFWSQPVAWPYMDTPGRVAAYKWLSYTLMTGNYYLTNPSGAHLDDLRFYYTGSQNLNFTNVAKDPTTVAFPGATGTTYCWSGPDTTKEQNKDMTPYPAPVCFTAADLLGGATPADLGVAGQLKLELGYLKQSIDYLGTATGNQGIGTVITGSENAIADSMFSAMAQVQNSYAAGFSAPASASPSKWLKLSGTLVSLGAKASPAFGVIGGLLNVASQIAAPKTAVFSDGIIPQAFAEYETTLSDLTSQKDAYIGSLLSGLDTARDNVYSDWAKLQTVGTYVADSSSPWYLQNQVSLENLTGPQAAAAASRYAFLKLLPKRYQIDYWPAQPVDTPANIGTQNPECTGSNCPCFYSYPSKTIQLPAWSWQEYQTPGQPTSHDIFVIGGQIGKDFFGDFTEQIPSADLLSTLFDPQGTLKLSRDLFYSPNGPFTRRNGPRLSDNLCYHPY